MNCPLCKSIDIQCISADDDPNTGYAFNLYQCICGAIIKDNVWKDKCIVVISQKNEISVISK